MLLETAPILYDGSSHFWEGKIDHSYGDGGPGTIGENIEQAKELFQNASNLSRCALSASYNFLLRR